MSELWQSRLKLSARLLILAAVFASALVYPFRLQNSVIEALTAWADQGGILGKLYMTQLHSQFASMHTPLVYKEMVVQGFLLALVWVFVFLRGLRTFGHGQSVPESLTWQQRLRALVRNPSAWSVLLIAYCTISVGVLSPTLRWSLRTLLELSLAIVLILTLLELQPGRRFLVQFMVSICICGAVVAGVGLLQHLDLAHWFLPTWADDAQQRNRMGSFIGHNTGLSSWLLFPLSFACYYVLCGKRKILRLISLLLVLLILFDLVAAQSRAIWLIVVILGPVYLYLLLRSSGRRMRLRYLLSALAALAALVMVQMVAPDSNPLARHAVPIIQRFQRDLANPDQLLRETRLRILVVSASLIAERPIFGHGLGAFQYVYPPAQGRYFLTHPNTRLGTTVKRTDLAHDDPLQWLIETGVVGSILLIIPIYLLFSSGYRRFRKMPFGCEKAMQTALIAPVIAVAAHSFVDFPFHIMPIALIACISLTLWSGWTYPVGTGADGNSWRDRSTRLFSLIILGLLLVLTPAAFVFVCREFIGDIYFSEGTSWIETSHHFPREMAQYQYAALERAREAFRRGLKVNPLDGAMYEGSALTYLNMAQIDYSALQRARAAGNQKEADAFREQAKRNVFACIGAVDNQLQNRDLRYHFTYYVMGQAYELWWRMEPQIPNYLASARRAYQMALDINPADSATLYGLAQVFDIDPQTRKYAFELRRKYFESDPEGAFKSYLQPGIDKAYRGDFGPATADLARARALLPGVWQVDLAEAELDLLKALWPVKATDRTKNPDFIEGEHLLKNIPVKEHDNDRVRYINMLYAMVRQDWKQALALADSLFASIPYDKDIRVMRRLAALRAGETRAAWPGEKDDFNYWRRKESKRIYYFPDEFHLAAQRMMRLVPDTTITVAEGLRTAAILEAYDERAMLTQLAEELYKDYPGDSGVQRLVRQYAPDQLGKAFTAPTSGTLSTAPR